MDCHYCQGLNTVDEQTTRFCVCEASQPFIVENMPAFVCRLCGDKSFSGDVISALEKIKNGEAKVSDMQVVRVFDFEQLDKAPERVADGSIYRVFGNQFLKEVPRISAMLRLESPQVWWDSDIQVVETWKTPPVTFSHRTTTISNFSSYISR